MYSPLESFIDNLDFSLIPQERKDKLDQVGLYLAPKLERDERVNIICVCTHNSRRSHLCQVWAKLAAMYYRIRKFNTYSGGTEVTAVNHQIVLTLENQGFNVMPLSDQSNPVYALKYDNELPAMHLFSKKYDHNYNPSEGFLAFMNCDHADKNCPTISGAEARFSINYQDPKISDGTKKQESVYLETSNLIGREMFYLFSRFK